MPDGTNPPKAGMTSSTLSVVQSVNSSYNGFIKGFTYEGTNYYLGYERGASADVGQWFYGTAAEIATNKNPQVKISQTSWTVISDGTYSSNDKTWSYDSNTYELQIQQISGDIWAEAVEI